MSYPINDGKSVIITTIFPTGEIPFYRRLVWSNEIENDVEEVNNYIRQLARDPIIVFDAAYLLAGANGHIRPAYGFDELHLNEQGYETLNMHLIRLLESFE